MKATLSLLGLYNYDSTILDGLTLPSNFTSDEETALKNNLLMETAELEIIYTNPTFLKYAITQWTAKESDKWNWLKSTQQYEYTPIWNADYKISDDTLETRNLSGTDDTTTQYTRNLTENEDITVVTDDDTNQTQTDNRTENITHESAETDVITNHVTAKSGDDTTTHSVYAYNDSSTGNPQYLDKTDYGSRTTENGTNTIDIDESTTRTNTGTTNVVTDRNINTVTDRDMTQTGGTTTTTDNDTTDTGTVDTTYNRTLQGNYGQTTTQQMIKEEQELAQFNVLDYIIESFKKRFCILVY